MIRVVVWLLALGLWAGAETGRSVLTGTWACQSMAAGAYTGRSCPLLPWLKLASDGSYEWGQEQGTWRDTRGTLSLSGREGDGRVNADGKLIFEYDLHGKHYVLTLYRRQP
ncbi:MAG: hypothetical protein C5B51_20340 [Terriglobia bacterium]|nr:MAG: hypothetical protein C5B51_20340 [Terriglobia bacterium]